MDIYSSLNDCIKYIEENLLLEIDFNYISKIFGFNISTIQKLFSLLTGMTINEYIRNRKLTLAVNDIKNNKKIMDIALKYGYSSDVSFSRAFKRYHGILPSKVKFDDSVCKIEPILKFDINKQKNKIEYKIKNLDKKVFYGIKKEVKDNNIPPVAEKLWSTVKREMTDFKKLGFIYGIIEETNENLYYYCASTKKIDKMEKIVIPKSKWISFKINSNKGEDIKSLFEEAFRNYLPSIGLKKIKNYEIEIYTEDYTEIYIMIN